jgi:hypothetical protein
MPDCTMQPVLLLPRILPVARIQTSLRRVMFSPTVVFSLPISGGREQHLPEGNIEFSLRELALAILPVSSNNVVDVM